MSSVTIVALSPSSSPAPVSFTANPLGWLWQKKELIAGAVVAAAAAKNLYMLSNPKHSVQPHAAQANEPIDHSLFPQFIKSVSVPSLWLFFRAWEVDHPRAVAFVCHGYGEHSGRYEALAARLNEVGVNVYSVDHQGHGQSDGDRAHVERFRDYVRKHRYMQRSARAVEFGNFSYSLLTLHSRFQVTDVLSFVEFIQTVRLKEQKPLPSFLLGHSMGGLIATQAMRASYTSSSQLKPVARADEEWHARLWPWSGCILSAPALAVDPRQAPPHLITIGTTLSNWFPKMQLNSLNVENISRIPTVVSHYRSDPLNYHGNMRARWGSEMLSNMEEVKADVENISWPLLIIQGEADTIVFAEGARYLYQKAQSKDKKLRAWAGGYHELFNDLPAVSDGAFREVAEWITTRSGGDA